MNEIEQLLKPVIQSQNIKNPKINVVGGSSKGDGYLGIITAVEIKGDNKTLKLVIKAAPSNEKVREEMSIRNIYINEINLYDRIYPAMRTCQLKNGDVKPFIKLANCYSVSRTQKHEALILENLKESGFVLFDRTELISNEHIILILQEYGKFHALSYALREKNANLFKELTDDINDNLLGMLLAPGFMDLMNKSFIKIKDYPVLKNDSKIYAALNQLHENYLSFYKNISPNVVDQYAVITHGDCWTNNMMFKYDDIRNPSTPTSMRLLDWQLEKFGSPVLDLSYFIYVCLDKKVFDNLDHYLHVYLDALRHQLRQLNCNEDYLTFDTLKNHWKKYAKHGLLMAFIVVKVMLSDPDEVPDLSEAAGSENKGVMAAFNYESKSDDEYRRRIVDLILHAHKIGVL